MWGYIMGKQKSREVVFGITNIARYRANCQVKIASFLKPRPGGAVKKRSAEISLDQGITSKSRGQGQVFFLLGCRL
jgi:hypothetical protein